MDSKTPEIAFATTNLPPVKAATAGPEEMRDIMHATGYDSIEVTPTRWFMYKLAQLAEAGFKDHEDVIEAVGSMHQTFARGIGRAALDCLTFQKSPLHLGVSLAMPERHNSLYEMHRLQHFLGRRLMAVVYGDYKFQGASVHFNQREEIVDDEDEAEVTNQADFLEVMTQVHPELFEIWGREDHGALLKEMLYKRGFTGVCWSAFHVRRQSRNIPGSVLDTNLLLRDIHEQEIPVPEVHFEIGRIDSVAPYDGDMLRTTQQELAAALASPERIARTELGEHLSRVFEIEQERRHGSVPRVVVEVPAMALDTDNLDRFMGMSRDIANHVRAFSAQLVKSSL